MVVGLHAVVFGLVCELPVFVRPMFVFLMFLVPVLGLSMFIHLLLVFILISLPLLVFLSLRLVLSSSADARCFDAVT
jgi:hypothetical protein